MARRLNVPTLNAGAFEAMIAQHINALVREELRTTGRVETNVTFPVMGQVRVLLERQKNRFVLPAVSTAPPVNVPGRAPGEVPSFMDRVREFFRSKP